MNLGQKLDNTQMSTLTKFFMVKSFITFYLIQSHKNAFHDELFLSIYPILQKELCFPGSVNDHSQISVLGCFINCC